MNNLRLLNLIIYDIINSYLDAHIFYMILRTIEGVLEKIKTKIGFTQILILVYLFTD